MEIEKLKKEIKDSWLDMENLFVSGFDLFSKDGKSFTLKSHKLDDILKEDNLEKLIAFKNRIEIIISEVRFMNFVKEFQD